MTPDRREMACWRMERARETLDACRLLFASGSHRDAVNRAYYAAFHAARALLATRELDSSKHSGVIALFNREFVKPGTVDRDLGKCLQELFQSRQEGDYSDFVQVAAEASERALEDAEMFVSRIAEVLQTLLGASDST